MKEKSYKKNEHQKGEEKESQRKRKRLKIDILAEFNKDKENERR